MVHRPGTIPFVFNIFPSEIRPIGIGVSSKTVTGSFLIFPLENDSFRVFEISIPYSQAFGECSAEYITIIECNRTCSVFNI